MKYAAALAIAFVLMLVPIGNAGKCDLCGKTASPGEMEAHIFEDEYDYGIEIYELNICPACVGEIE